MDTGHTEGCFFTVHMQGTQGYLVHRMDAGCSKTYFVYRVHTVRCILFHIYRQDTLEMCFVHGVHAGYTENTVFMQGTYEK